MESMEREAVFVVADISGYTRFILSNDKEIAHSQMIVRELLTALLEEVKLPLQLIRLEGDAIFMFALKDDPERPWGRVSRSLVFNLMAFFKVFADKVAELTLHKICNCTACNNIERLKLKAVVHSGRAAFFQIGSHQELTGGDVIIAKRLLKNSVDAEEYILLTERAYRELTLPGGQVEEGKEHYPDIGSLKTYIYYPPAPEPYVPDPDAKPPTIFIETLRTEVSKEYATVATYPELGFHFHTGRRLADLLAYAPSWLEGLPEKAIESFAGTGNHFLIEELRPGERVLDAGSGAGLDAFIARRMIGPEGEIIGVDMTAEMVQKAKTLARELGFRNVFFKQGLLEELPVPDEWADVVISNGAVNLAPDKKVVFSEFFRALKPGGRLQVADILVQKPIPASARRKIDLWAG